MAWNGNDTMKLKHVFYHVMLIPWVNHAQKIQVPWDALQKHSIYRPTRTLNTVSDRENRMRMDN